MTGFEKQMVMLSMMYPEIPENGQAAAEKAVKFLNGGNENNGEGFDAPRLYSFSKDANFIFAAFKQTHGVDLSDTEYMHWWKFMALFMDLGSDTTFCSLISLRKRVKSGKATPEEVDASREMGDLFELKDFDTRTLEEKDKEAEFMELLGSAK